MSKHQKRISAPRSWPIKRKTEHWAVNPRPGPHPKHSSVALMVVIRDVLKLADNAKEAKKVLKEGSVVVNGRIMKDHKLPVGIFDIISIPRLGRHYRVLVDRKGRINLTQIDEEAARTKLCRVDDKTIMKDSVVQLNLHDGRNIIGDNDIKTGDSLAVSLEDGGIVGRFAYRVGSKAMVIGGKHSGEVGSIKEIRIVRSSLPNMVLIERPDGGSVFETVEDYVFIVGENKVEVNLEGTAS